MYFSTWKFVGNVFKIISDDRCIADVSHQIAANRFERNTDKTELLRAGSKYGPALLGSSGPPLQLGEETIAASNHVCLLDVAISSDLSLEKHVSIISST